MVLLLLLFSLCVSLCVFVCVCAFVHVFHLIARERFSVSYFVIYVFVSRHKHTHICFASARSVFTNGCHKMHKHPQTHTQDVGTGSFRIYFLIILFRETCNFLCFSFRSRSVMAHEWRVSNLCDFMTSLD